MQMSGIIPGVNIIDEKVSAAGVNGGEASGAVQRGF